MQVQLHLSKLLPKLDRVKTDDTQFPDNRRANRVLGDIEKALNQQSDAILPTIAKGKSYVNQARLLEQDTTSRENNVIAFKTQNEKIFILPSEKFFVDKSKATFLKVDGLSEEDVNGINRLYNPEASSSKINIDLPYQKIEAYARKGNQSQEYLSIDYEATAAMSALKRSLAVFVDADDGTTEGANFAKWGIEQFRKLNEHHKQTVIHSYSVYELTVEFCKFLKLDSNLSKSISYAALPHDIGKLRVDKTVLQKKGQLTKEDWEQIKGHPVEGFKIAKENGINPKIADLPVVLWHHKSTNKKAGYPDGAPSELTLGTEIVHVVDVYNALTGFREYREPVDPRIAMKLILRGKGVDFNSKIADEFSGFLGFNPKELEREIEVDKHILKALHNGSGVIFNSAEVGKLMSKNEYRLSDLQDIV